MATYYVDGTKSDDSGDGLSEANAKKTFSAAQTASAADGDTIYVKTSTNYPPITISKNIVIEGYGSTPGTRDAKPTITSATNSQTLVSIAGIQFSLASFILSHTAATRGNGIAYASGFTDWHIADLIIDGCSYGVRQNHGNSRYTMSRVVVKNCTTAATDIRGGGYFITDCAFIDNALGFYCFPPYEMGSAAFTRCLFAGNTSHGFICATGGYNGYVKMADCIFAYNGGNGAYMDATGYTVATDLHLNNCISYGNTAYGIRSVYPTGPNLWQSGSGNGNAGNAYGGNGLGDVSGVPVFPNDITLTADPFVDAANGDYLLNEAAGGGALLRASIVDYNGMSMQRFGHWIVPSEGGGGSALYVPRGSRVIG